jgi:hypothetical protein
MMRTHDASTALVVLTHLISSPGGRAAGEVAAAAAARAHTKQGDAGPRVWVGGEVPGFEALGGLPHVVGALREMALLPLLQPGLLRALGINAPR